MYALHIQHETLTFVNTIVKDAASYASHSRSSPAPADDQAPFYV